MNWLIWLYLQLSIFSIFLQFISTFVAFQENNMNSHMSIVFFARVKVTFTGNKFYWWPNRTFESIDVRCIGEEKFLLKLMTWFLQIYSNVFKGSRNVCNDFFSITYWTLSHEQIRSSIIRCLHQPSWVLTRVYHLERWCKQRSETESQCLSRADSKEGRWIFRWAQVG
jgi:hypothetical protein